MKFCYFLLVCIDCDVKNYALATRKMKKKIFDLKHTPGNCVESNADYIYGNEKFSDMSHYIFK